MKYDIVIVSHEKDYNKIKYVVEYAEKNLHGFDSIHLIISEKEFTETIICSKPIYVHKEQDVLSLDFSRINYRPNWIYQILLKMFQDVTLNDNFLILESDGIVNSKLSFFENDKTVFYLGINHSVHTPYLRFNNSLGLMKKYPHSLISEVMMYDKKKIKKLLEYCGCETREEFIENHIYDNLTNEYYPADYELYGNFMYNLYPDEITFVNYKYLLNGKNGTTWTDNEISETINNNKNYYDYISFHTWL